MMVLSPLEEVALRGIIDGDQALDPAVATTVFPGDAAIASLKEKPSPTDFRVEVEVNGEVQQFDGTISPKLETGTTSDIIGYEFDYDPAQRLNEEAAKKKEEAYAAYDDKTIKKQWGEVIPPENILLIEEPKAIIDVMLGALGIYFGVEDLDGVIANLRTSNQSEKRIHVVQHALRGLRAPASEGTVTGDVPSAPEGARRKGRSKRL